jgi:CDP-diacylglycerol--glycerol-3-phosphate 3-phosphatidyltransferase
MNLPNTLTLVRMFLVPLLVVVLLTEFEGRRIFGMPRELVGAAIFGLASITDWLDGYIARRRRQVTWLGQMLDPIADKLLTSAAFICRAIGVRAGLDSGTHHWAPVRHHRAAVSPTPGHYDPASPLGKLKMASQVTAILLILGWGRSVAGADRLYRAVGRDAVRGLRGRLLSPLPASAQRASPTSTSRVSVARVKEQKPLLLRLASQRDVVA